LIEASRLLEAKTVADRELLHQKTLLSVFVQNAPAAIVMCDLHLDYLAASSAWCEQWQLNHDEIIGDNHHDLMPSISPEWMPSPQRALAGEHVVKERDYWTPQGSSKQIIIRWEMRPWYAEIGIIGGIIILTQDITQQIEREIELERMRNAAEEATYAKSQFLANISHEIRTPLTSIIGFAEIGKEHDVTSAERIKAFETILNNGNHLLGIINDLLDLSKIDFGAMQIEAVPFSPVRLLENLRVLMEPRFHEKGLTLAVLYCWDLPETITSDSLRLMQILVNLTSNALKFTQKGRVEITVYCDRVNEHLHFSFIDTGIGITADQQSKLFKPFSQAEKGTTRKYGGTGLGLSISKLLVEKLGGTISVISEPNVGSEFSFYIETGDLKDVRWISHAPAVLANLDELVRSSPPIKGKVLIADDAADNRNLLKFTLRKTNLELTLVEDGEAAVKTALADNFDLILLDMQMPIMDGYTAAREIRKHGITVPIVAFTANAMKHEIAKCLEAGCSMHLPKPVTKSALYQCLEHYLRTDSPCEQAPEMVFSETLGNDPEERELVISFFQGLTTRLAGISEAIPGNDFAVISKIAHKISGSAGLYGFSAMSDLAANLHTSAKRKDFESCKKLYEQMCITSEAILRGIRELEQQETANSEIFEQDFQD